jgi:hypothetical protein
MRVKASSRLLSSGDPANNPPVQQPLRAQFGIKENETGSQWKWLLQSLGFYSKESVNIRSSAMLYLNAREQAARPEFYRSLGNVNSLRSICIVFERDSSFR